MKTNAPIVENKKTLKRALIGFVFLFQCASSFTQVNPWENNSTENPWKVEEKNPSEAPSLPVQKDSISVSDDSISQVNSPEQSQDDQAKSTGSVQNTIVLQQDSRQYLLVVQQEARLEYRAPVAFIGSFLTGGVFLMLAAPFNLISNVIPTPRAKEYLKNYSEKHPKAIVS